MFQLGITISNYKRRPFFFPNRHLETIFPSVFFKSFDIYQTRERLELTDGDFLDLDWAKNDSDQLVILSHGLEGSTDRYYMTRMGKFFIEKGWDILAWNNRGCSGEMNRKPILYHHGSSEDLGYVLYHALTLSYKKIFLIGFSMGGSHVAKLLSTHTFDQRVLGGVGFSVSTDMEDMMSELEKKGNGIYKKRFLQKMKEKVGKLDSLHPGLVNIDNVLDVETFDEFHKNVTVPLMGYKNIDEFYYDSSCANFLTQLKKPFLIVNAQNDPILGDNCYPRELAEKVPGLELEIPKQGGHLGFNYVSDPYSYMEYRSYEYLTEIINK